MSFDDIWVEQEPPSSLGWIDVDAHDELARMHLALQEEKEVVDSGLEVIGPGETFFLFDGAKIAQDDHGRTFVTVPRRAIDFPRAPRQILNVRCGPYYDAGDNGVRRWTVSGQEFFIPDAVLDPSTEKAWLQVEVSLEDPRGDDIPAALEEQAMTITFGDTRFVTRPDRELLAGGGLVYEQFLDLEDPNPFSIESQSGGKGFALTPGLSRRLIVPADEAILLELQASFPGA